MTVPFTPEHDACAPEDQLTALFTRDVLREQLAAVSNLGRRALLETLLPHRQLLPYDPAGYVIAARRQSGEDLIEVDSAYDLGVVFGRSLLMSCVDSEGLPVVSEFAPSRKQLIDGYLRASSLWRHVSRTHGSDQHAHDINKTIKLFAKFCETNAPDLMLDGTHHVKHGFYDYVNVATLAVVEDDDLEPTYEGIVYRLKFGHLAVHGTQDETRPKY